jgi:hypothetical protein
LTDYAIKDISCPLLTTCGAHLMKEVGSGT